MLTNQTVFATVRKFSIIPDADLEKLNWTTPGRIYRLYSELSGALEVADPELLDVVKNTMNSYGAYMNENSEPTFHQLVELTMLGEVLLPLAKLDNYLDVRSMYKCNKTQQMKKVLEDEASSIFERTCVCGRVCESVTGLKVHQHACDGFKMVDGYGRDTGAEVSGHGPLFVSRGWMNRGSALLIQDQRESFIRHYIDTEDELFSLRNPGYTVVVQE